MQEVCPLINISGRLGQERIGITSYRKSKDRCQKKLPIIHTVKAMKHIFWEVVESCFRKILVNTRLVKLVEKSIVRSSICKFRPDKCEYRHKVRHPLSKYLTTGQQKTVISLFIFLLSLC